MPVRPISSAPQRSPLTAGSGFAYLGRDGSPTDELRGINREHGADDPIGANAVTAPATVSGLCDVSAAEGSRPLGDREGHVHRQSARTETARQHVNPIPGGAAWGEG